VMVWTAVLVTAAGLTSLQEGAVLLRGPVGSRAAAVSSPTAVGSAGVTVAGGSIIPWDQIKQVTGPLAVEAEKYRSLAERAWRGPFWRELLVRLSSLALS